MHVYIHNTNLQEYTYADTYAPTHIYVDEEIEEAEAVFRDVLSEAQLRVTAHLQQVFVCVCVCVW